MRRILPAAVLAVALLAAGFVGLTANHRATAQEPTEVVFVFSDRFQPGSDGRTGLIGGTNDGIQGIMCSGSNPQGGTAQIPTQVLTQLLSDVINIRVFNHQGQPVSGLIRLNCTVDVLVPPEPTATAKQALAQRKLQPLSP